jgi:hypothetical protein
MGRTPGVETQWWDLWIATSLSRMRHGSEDTASPRGVGDIIGLEVAAVLTRTGPSVYLLNRLYRDDDDGEGERDREGAVRRHFDEHARRPDEQASDASARPERRA